MQVFLLGMLLVALFACKENTGENELTIPHPTVHLTAGDAAAQALGFIVRTTNSSEVRWACIPSDSTLTLEALLAEGSEARTNREDEVFAEGLTYLTDYTIYAVARNGRHYAEAEPIQMTTLDLPLPVLESRIVELLDVSFKLEISSTHSTEVRWTCVERDSVVSTELLWSEGRRLSGNRTQEVTMEGLTPESDYTIYLAARNERHEVAAAPLEITTREEGFTNEEESSEPDVDPGEGPGYIGDDQKPEVGPLKR